VLYLGKLNLFQFKNYGQTQIHLLPQVNCFVGKNGAGKTNLLDAIYYLSFTKSFFGTQDQQHVMAGTDDMRIEGTYYRNSMEEEVEMIWQKGKKHIKVNNNDVKRFSEHIGNYPLVMIAPNDIMLIYEGSEDRRKFLDGMIAQTDKLYLTHLLTYNRSLEQRNRLLKNYAEGGMLDPLLLESYNEQLIQSGTLVYDTRKQFLLAYTPVFQQFYERISEAAEPVSITYTSDLHHYTFADLLQYTESQDLSAARTTKGIHKDDIEFTIGNYPLRKRGSQGQQKSFIIALKLAQYDYLKQATQNKPLLLLDDIFEKLDGQRLHLLLSMIANDVFGQICISDTHLDRLHQVFQPMQVPVKYFMIDKGIIHEI
jgi:DNA replication and repair protein RecF